jgi:hypothetical protein
MPQPPRGSSPPTATHRLAARSATRPANGPQGCTPATQATRASTLNDPATHHPSPRSPPPNAHNNETSHPANHRPCEPHSYRPRPTTGHRSATPRRAPSRRIQPVLVSGWKPITAQTAWDSEPAKGPAPRCVCAGTVEWTWTWMWRVNVSVPVLCGAAPSRSPPGLWGRRGPGPALGPCPRLRPSAAPPTRAPELTRSFRGVRRDRCPDCAVRVSGSRWSGRRPR